jgi:hypothetical protein
MQASRTNTYERMREMLNEKQWRHYLALEAQARGSVMQIAREAGVSHNTRHHPEFCVMATFPNKLMREDTTSKNICMMFNPHDPSCFLKS